MGSQNPFGFPGGLSPLSPFWASKIKIDEKRESIDYFTTVERELDENPDMELLQDVSLDHLKDEKFFSPSQYKFTTPSSGKGMKLTDNKENFLGNDPMLLTPLRTPTSLKNKRTLESIFNEVNQQQQPRQISPPKAKRPSPPKPSTSYLPSSLSSSVVNDTVTAAPPKYGNLPPTIEMTLNRIRAATASASGTSSSNYTAPTMEYKSTFNAAAVDEDIKEKERRLQSIKEQLSLIKQNQISRSNMFSNSTITDSTSNVSGNLDLLTGPNIYSLPSTSTPTMNSTYDFLSNKTTFDASAQASTLKARPKSPFTPFTDTQTTKSQEKEETMPSTLANIFSKTTPSPVQNTTPLDNVTPKEVPQKTSGSSSIPKPTLAKPSSSSIPRLQSSSSSSALPIAPSRKTPTKSVSLSRVTGKQAVENITKLSSEVPKGSKAIPTSLQVNASKKLTATKITTKKQVITKSSSELNLTTKVQKQVTPPVSVQKESSSVTPDEEWERKVQMALEQGTSGIPSSTRRLMYSPEEKKQEKPKINPWSPVRGRGGLTFEESCYTCTKKTKD